HDATKCLCLACRHGRLKPDDLCQTETFDLRAQRIAFGAVPNQRCCHLPPLAIKTCYRVYQDIYAFDRPELAQENKISCVGSRLNGRKFPFRHAVVDDSDEATRRADLAAKNFSTVGAF